MAFHDFLKISHGIEFENSSVIYFDHSLSTYVNAQCRIITLKVFSVSKYDRLILSETS